MDNFDTDFVGPRDCTFAGRHWEHGVFIDNCSRRIAFCHSDVCDDVLEVVTGYGVNTVHHLVATLPNGVGGSTCHQQWLAVLLGNLRNGLGYSRGVGAEYQIHFVLCNQAFIESGTGGGVGLVVVDHELYRPAEQTTICIFFRLPKGDRLPAGTSRFVRSYPWWRPMLQCGSDHRLVLHLLAFAQMPDGLLATLLRLRALSLFG